ncbi:MAG: N-acetylmuramoyl-L-alanine amidase [Clostridia bacterium]|nr:N-acetylmuramoyl-L-alanine amidase [Clostridia bacterium]
MKNDKPIFYTIRFALISFISAVMIFLIGFAFTNHMKNANSSTSLPVFNENDKIRFVIDAGHGGEDAGAIAEDGTLEKDLNLSIAKLLGVVLELNGNEVVMTRTTDTLLYDYYDDLEDYTGQKKVYDLRNRLKIASEKENSIYVGIHMNKFSMSKYSGLQVYYSPNNDISYNMADSVKTRVKECLQPDNNRGIKRADSSIYILNHAQIPAVLIECGFLSNEGELALLKSQEYQCSLAITLFSSIIGYGN